MGIINKFNNPSFILIKRKIKNNKFLINKYYWLKLFLNRILRIFFNVKINGGIWKVLAEIYIKKSFDPLLKSSFDYKNWIELYEKLSLSDIHYLKKKISTFEKKPLISILMPTYNSNHIWLSEAIESVVAQIYTNWELCICDDASTDPEIKNIIKKFTRQDPRIKCVFRDVNGHICNASNSALDIASGDWIALVDHDDLLPSHALFWVVDSINHYPDVRMIYSDEDKLDENGERIDPYFKCDWNEDLFYSHNMFSHLGVYDKSLVQEIGGFRIGYEGSQDYDLALRCIERIKPSMIHHIPRVLYHWRIHNNSTAKVDSKAKPYAMISGEKALNDHFKRKKLLAHVESIEYGYRARYHLPKTLPLVSLIIPTRNSYDLTKKCIQSILSKTTYWNYQIIIVDNGSDDKKILDYFDTLKRDPRFRIIRDDGPFNYSKLNNKAVNFADGELIGLINNDIEVISDDWLSEMVSHALREDVGAVGAKLLYPDNTLQHCGIILGLGGVCAHSHRNIKSNNYGYFGRARLIQSFSAVTAACLIVRKKTYLEIGGLDENNLKVAYNDVDFCLRLREAGYRNIWTPYAELYHHESASRGDDSETEEKRKRFAQEQEFLINRWKHIISDDPAYSPNLTLDREDFSLAFPPRVKKIY